MSVHFINVDQGDATYIKTPNGDDILNDAGNKGKGDMVVSYLKKLKVDDIEVLISTHPGADHVGGLKRLCP
ncbi:MBL fold metallo-hydrolase [Paenisporosarcina sp. FSL H8-0542]|uniref:MBL fold metallo-hydrolase n=1 Tax=Paenisporosarcina sp. FSL H8-0542 TaxID=2921401 RepID=UPI003159B9C2